jgi:3-dehydroquinate synthase
MHKKIKVKTPSHPKNSYDILVGISLEDVAVDIAKLYSGASCFIITDSNVHKLYGKRFEKLLNKRGIKVHTIIFKAGEKRKTRKTKQYLEDRILKLGAKRDSIIIALGGGVVGDIAGFTAATINRGIPYIQIPTTLLAQVDSSVGGKVGVDHPLGKNLVGAFYQPERVYIDPETLSTLSDLEYRNGLAEVVKYGAILDNDLFHYLERNWIRIQRRDAITLSYIIERCCSLKASVVETDELETGYRRILNFGHTIGHAIELLSNYKVNHGCAVSIGMTFEAQLAQRIGILRGNYAIKIAALLLLFGLPIRIPNDIKMSDIIKATQRDKKAVGQKIYYTLLSKIGKGVINVPLNSEDVGALLISRNLSAKFRL